MSLTKKEFAKFIDSINYRIWMNALNNVDNENSNDRFGGIFFLYTQIINVMKKENSDYKEMEDSLKINEALYDIALEKKFYSFCDFQTIITREMVVDACIDIKQYMIENLKAFDDQGLVHICFQKLMLPEENDKLGHGFWERCLKEIFELYRMIPE